MERNALLTFMKSWMSKPILFLFLLFRNHRYGCVAKYSVSKALYFNSCYIFGVAVLIAPTKEGQDSQGKESIYTKLPRD